MKGLVRLPRYRIMVDGIYWSIITMLLGKAIASSIDSNARRHSIKILISLHHASLALINGFFGVAVQPAYM